MSVSAQALPNPGQVVPIGSLVTPSGPAGPPGGGAEVGSIKYWPSVTPPSGWGLLDGAAVSRTMYPELFALIGTTFGAGDGSTTFNKPDARSRFILSYGQGVGTSPPNLTLRNLGDIGGEEKHQLLIAEITTHSHPIAAGQFSHNHGLPSMGVGNSGGTGLGTWLNQPSSSTAAATLPAGNTDSVGGSVSHNTMPPFICFVLVIKMSPGGGATNQAPIANTSQAGLMNQLSGLTTDYVGGDNQCHNVGAAAQPTIWAARLRSFNAIGNPNFEVDQRHVGGVVTVPAGTSNPMIIDRWLVSKIAATGTCTTGQSADTYTIVPGTNFAIGNNNFYVTVGTVQATLAAGEFLSINQNIEGPVLRELINDVHSLQLLAFCTNAISFAISLIPSGAAYSYVSPLLNLPANTWTLFTIPNIPIWTSNATWSTDPGTLGYSLRICLGAGSTYQTSNTGSWISGNYLAPAGVTNLLSLSGAIFRLGFVQHEPGSVCTTLIDKPFDDNLRQCKRYYGKSNPYASIFPTNAQYQQIGCFATSTTVRAFISYEVEVAKQPTVTLASNTGVLGQVFVDAAAPTNPGASAGLITTRVAGQISLTAALTTPPNSGAAVLGQWQADTGW